jgi:hypothetical protein
MKFLLPTFLLALSVSTNSFGIIVSNTCDVPGVGMTTDFACGIQGINTIFTDQRYNARDKCAAEPITLNECYEENIWAFNQGIITAEDFGYLNVNNAVVLFDRHNSIKGWCKCKTVRD